MAEIKHWAREEYEMKTVLVAIVLFSIAVISTPVQADTAVHPAKISAGDMSGALFESPDTIRTEGQDGSTTLDITSLLSSDGKFASGMYRSGKSRFEVTEPYGVDEFMYFLEGGVTLTSSDGTVTEIESGDAVTIPKEWTGIWETAGYTKIWVIYSADGSGL